MDRFIYTLMRKYILLYPPIAASASRAQTRVGPGLSLNYDIITKGHNGQLKVETTEGEGSRFIISLPIA
jgi:two-component system NtrC family sensor kinase